MADDKNILQFVSSREAESTIWYLDGEAKDIVVTRCESCQAEARHAVNQLEEDFSFVHNAGCPYAPPPVEKRSRNDRAHDLAARIGVVLESEPDEELVVSTLALVSAIACEVAAQHSSNGNSLNETADRFVRSFKRALPAAAWSSTQRSGRSRDQSGELH